MSGSQPGDSSESDDDDERMTVSVSSSGQATIPKAFREKLGIEAPGQVTFRETKDGDIVLERVPTVDEMQGFAARTAEAETDTAASELLRKKRADEKQERDAE